MDAIDEVKTETGIRNTTWTVYEQPWAGMFDVVSKYRSKDGILWGSNFTISQEVLEDDDVEWMLVHMLEDAWCEFKRFLESRYRDLMDYEKMDSPRLEAYHSQHPEAWFRFHGVEVDEEGAPIYEDDDPDASS